MRFVVIIYRVNDSWKLMKAPLLYIQLITTVNTGDQGMGKPVNSLIKLTAYLVDRETGKIVLQRTFRNRLPGLLLVKLSAWLFSIEDEFPKEKYKLMVSLDGEMDHRMEFLRNKFRELGITIVEEPLRVVA